MDQQKIKEIVAQNQLEPSEMGGYFKVWYESDLWVDTPWGRRYQILVIMT